MLIYIFYEGKVNWWLPVSICRENIAISEVVQFFLEKLENATKEHVTLEQISIYTLSESKRIKKDNISEYIPYSKSTDLEILVKLNEETEKPKQTIKNHKNIPKYLEIGKNYCEKGDYRTGFDFLSLTGKDEALEIFRILRKVKKWDIIGEMLPDMLKMYPKSEEVALINGEYLEHIGKNKEAITTYRELVNTTKTFYTNVYMSRAHYNLGEIALAKLALNYVLSNYKTEPKVISQIVNVNLKSKDTKSCDYAIKACLSNPKAYKYIAKLVEVENGVKLIHNMFNTLNIPERGRDEIIWIIYKEGKREEALQLAYMSFIYFDRSTIISIVYLYMLLLEGRTNTFLEVIQLFLEKHSCESYEFISYVEFQNMFATIGTDDADNIRFLFNKDINGFTCHIPNEHVVICVIIEVFLYLNRNYTEAKAVSALIFGLHIIELKEIPECDVIRRLYALCCDQPILVDFNPPLDFFYVIGDEFLLKIGLAPVTENKQSTFFKQAPLPGISLWQIIYKTEEGLPQRFYDMLEYARKFSNVIFFLGTNDCELEIPKRIRKIEFQTIKEAVDAIIDKYVDIINNFKEENPQINIFVHPALPRYNSTYAIADIFNKELKAKLGESAHFLDCLPNGKFPMNPSNIISYQKSLRKYISNIIEPEKPVEQKKRKIRK